MLLAFALSSVVTYRISNFIVIGNINSTRLTAYASVIISFGVMAVSAGLVYVLSVYLAAIYTSDPDVRGRVVNLAPLAAIFMIPYGLTGSIMGILRGLGHQYLLAKISFLSFWLAGLPTGLYLNFWARYTYSSLLSCGEFVGYMLLTQFSLVVTTNEIMLCKRFYDTAFGLFLREKVPLQMLPVPLEITREQQGVTETFEIPYGFDDINDEQKKNLKENLLIAYDKLKAQVQIMQWKFYANLFIFVVTTSVSYFYFYIECFITFPSATILYMVYAIFVVQYCVALQILSVNRRVKKLEEQFFIKSHLGVHLKGWKPREELLVRLIVTFGITTFSLLGKLAKNGKFQQSDDC
jgi:hypothetical protein